jgi:cytochrome c
MQGENMKAVAVFLGVAAVALAAPSQAQEALAKKHKCFACHAIDKKLVGPSYKDVAAKYAKDPNAEAKLAEKVKKGGSGVWGPIPMPPNTAVKDPDIKKMVELILALKK